MMVVAVNSGRAGGSTSALAARALEGAAALGAETEMIMLAEHDIKYCTNCLLCYQDLESDIAPCSIDDDMSGILEKLRRANGVILASPVHSGFVNGLMTTFMERCIFRLCTPTGELLGLKGCPMPRLTDKTRASASIMCAGMVPPELRHLCDLATPWLREGLGMLFNGAFVADMYAGAVFDHPLSERETSRGFLLRKLSDQQLDEASRLGETVARAVLEGVPPFNPNDFQQDAPEAP